jgi:putative ABC transport system substrate-binding protein
MNNRRRLVIALGAATVMPRTTLAQSKPKPILIGYLSLGGGARPVAFSILRQSLMSLGWKEGVEFTLDARWAEGQTQRLRPLAEELAARRPAVIVAAGVRAAQAATKAAPNIPIVVFTLADPVAAGLAASFARPGGMVTGVTALAIETSGKHLELLFDCVPKIRRIGILMDPTAANAALWRNNLQRTAARLSVATHFAEAASRTDVETALSRLVQQEIEALVVMFSDVFYPELEAISKFALVRRWPVASSLSRLVELGALLSYSGDQSATYGRVAYYVDRILKGAKPGDLPIEQSATFELAINLKTAKALGITIPPAVMVQATNLIE